MTYEFTEDDVTEIARHICRGTLLLHEYGVGDEHLDVHRVQARVLLGSIGTLPPLPPPPDPPEPPPPAPEVEPRLPGSWLLDKVREWRNYWFEPYAGLTDEEKRELQDYAL